MSLGGRNEIQMLKASLKSLVVCILATNDVSWNHQLAVPDVRP